MTDRCIVCGAEIPEGRQICLICEIEGVKRGQAVKSAAGARQEGDLADKYIQVHPEDGKRNTERFCGICESGAQTGICCISPNGALCPHWGRMLCTHPNAEGWVRTARHRGEAPDNCPEMRKGETRV